MTAVSAGRQQGERAPWRTHRLWSLWDIMEPFDPVAFLHIHSFTGRYESSKKFIAENKRTLSLMRMLGRLHPNIVSGGEITDKDRKSLDETYVAVEKLCTWHELAASLATTKKMRACLQKPKSKYEDLHDLAIELRGRLIDEMGERHFFSLTLEETRYYQESRQGWEEVIERLPDTVGDIEEARKCFALSRYAAAVFHSVQVVETGLLTLGKTIGVTDPLSGWSAVTATLGKILTTNYKQRTPFQQQHSQFLEQIHGTLEALKNAWRNKVSHAQGKLTLLTADFSKPVAEEILFATRGFMRRLATEMPEPQP